MAATGWRFGYRAEGALPPLSWLATINAAAKAVDVACGKSVRCQEKWVLRGHLVGVRVDPADVRCFPISD